MYLIRGSVFLLYTSAGGLKKKEKVRDECRDATAGLRGPKWNICTTVVYYQVYRTSYARYTTTSMCRNIKTV